MTVNTVSACRILGLSRATLYRKMKAGILKFEVRAGHRMVRL